MIVKTTKEINGKVYDYTYSDDGMMNEVLTMSQVAEDSGGGKWRVYANIVRYTDVKRIKIA